MRKSSKSFRGFSLIEVSVIIVIIGVFVAGTMVGTRLVAKSRLAAAESLARSSPVPGIKDNVLWLETSLSGSIDSLQENDGTSITAWYDQSSSAAKPTIVAVGTGPTYANTINYVHAIKFTGSTANYLQITDASFLNNTDYTIMVLEKRQSNASSNYFIGDSSGLSLGYSADSTVVHSQGGANSYSSTVSSYASSTDKARQFTFVHSASSGNSTYINGILAAQDATKTAHLTGVTSLAIGKGYTGEIGEIAIFTRALKLEERQSVEDYAGKKWTRSINRSAVSGGSCIGYTVTDSGCDLSASPCSINVTGLVASVSPTTSSTSIACNQTNYSGSVNYTCINGTANVTGSCGCVTGYTGVGCTSCDTANGYFLSGGSCIKQCNYNVTGGSPTTGTVTSASGTIACNTASHYSASGFAYTCSGGATISGTCACATGYTGAGCSTCDTANHYVSVSGSCVLGCTIPAGSGTSTTSVAAGTTSVTCNSAGYSGTLQYTCSNSGSFVPTKNCTAAPTICTGGTLDTSISGTTIHMFTTSGTLNCSSSVARNNVQVLVVAGGGGGTTYGGGGGGGGVVYKTNHSLSATSYNVTVGTGGAGNIDVNGGNGGNSVFDTMTAYGGGGGTSGSTPVSGGSGGGSGRDSGNSVGGSVLAGIAAGGTSYGNVGGGSQNNGWDGGGGGGGAGAAGGLGRGNGSTSGEVGGKGGNGIAIAITSGSTASYPGTYGGGGGGSVSGNTSTSSGGTGGGGSGGRAGTNGTANTGGGGGGGMKIGQNTGGTSIVGSGGSGVVIIRYTN